MAAISNDWLPVLKEEFGKPYYRQLFQTVNQEYRTHQVFPPAEDIFNGEKRLPYTEGLFGSIPDLTKRTRRLSPIEGLMPDPTDLPKGCKFHDRCPNCMEICRTTVPPEVQTESHLIRCHLMAETSEGGAIR